MRKIAIDKIQSPDYQSHYIKQKQYQVFLGNGAKCYFTNKKDAKQFVAETNRFLNDRIHEINYMYGLVFNEYRAIWFFLHDTDKTKIIGKKIIEALNMVDVYLNNAVNRSKTINGNHFTFKNVYGVIENLTDILNLINQVLEQRKYFRDLKRCKTFTRQLNFVKTELDNFGIPKL